MRIDHSIPLAPTDTADKTGMINKILIYILISSFFVGCKFDSEFSLSEEPSKVEIPNVELPNFDFEEISTNEKTLTWSCKDNLNCEYRAKLAQSDSFEFTNEPTTSQKNYVIDSSVPEGEYYFYLQAKGADGAYSKVNKVKIKIDRTPPTITTTFPDYVYSGNLTSASFSGSCNETSKVYIVPPKLANEVCTASPCQGAIEHSCSANYNQVISDLNTLAEGTYAIVAYAVDSAGNVSALKTKQFTLDKTLPSYQVHLPLPNGGTVNSLNMGVYSVSGTCSDSGQLINFSGAISASALCLGGSWSSAFDLSAHPDGTILIKVNYSDEAGNQMVEEEISLTKNTTSVTGSIAINAAALYTNSTNVTLNLSSGSATAMYITETSGCGTGGVWESFTASKSYTLSNTNANNTVYVKYRNAFANESACYGASITHDNSAPVVSLTTPTTGATVISANQASFTVSGNCSENGREVSIAISTASASPTCSSGTFTANLNLTSLPDGPYTVNASQTDLASNTGSAAGVNINKSIAAITATLTNTPTGANGTSTLDVTVGGVDVATYAFKIGDGTTDCTSSAGYSAFISVSTHITVSTSGINDGTIKLCAIGKDPWGTTQNHNSATSATWTKDTTAPVAASGILLGADFAPTTGLSSPTITWTDGTDPGSGVASHEIKIVDANTNTDITSYAAHTKGTAKSGLTLSAGKYKVKIKVTDNLGLSSESSSNDFVICPNNYVYIPALSPFTTAGFCAMKWEAKNSAGTAVSQVSGLPETNIVRATAITRCTNNGSKYDLINNSEWMSIARNIESVGSNWSGGSVKSGFISMGSHNSSTSQLCDGNYVYSAWNPSCSGSTGDFAHKRTHTLSNGQVIWDLGGNAKEFVKGSFTSPPQRSNTSFSNEKFADEPASYNTVGWVLNDGSSGSINSLFGPSSTSLAGCKGWGNYHCGMGNAGVDYVSEILLRGGGVGSGGGGGIYSVDFYYYESDFASDFGYRCVYHP